MKGANRSARILEIGARAAQRLANGDDRFILTDHLALEFASIASSFSRLLLLHPLERHAGPLRDDVHHVVVVTSTSFSSSLISPLGKDRVEAILGLFLTCHARPRLFEILSLDRRFLLDADLLDLRFSISFTSGGRVIAAMRAREPASSITSMALSGRKRPVR